MGWMDGWVVNSDASKLPQKNLTKAMNHKSRNFFFPDSYINFKIILQMIRTL